MSLVGEKKKHIYGGRKIKKIIEFHNEKQTKKLLLSNKTNKKKQRRKQTENEQKHKNQRVSMGKNDQLKIKKMNTKHKY